MTTTAVGKQTPHSPPSIHPKNQRIKKMLYVALVLTLKLAGNHTFHLAHHGLPSPRSGNNCDAAAPVL
jgi:hypothetical protein